nr:EamA family transporter [Geomicrobium halophilum]
MFGSLGGYFFKQASKNGLGLTYTFIGYFLLGGLLYGIGAILNIYTLQFLPYTVVFPLTSITYIWTFLIAYFFLNESITVQKVIGVLLIIAGSVFLIPTS